MGQKKSKASKVTLEQIVARCGVKEECLKKECSQEHLLKLAEYCDSLTVVGLALGLSEIQISDIDKDHRTTEEKRVALVQKWKQSSAFNATYKNFIRALLACGRAEQASEVCRMLAANVNVPALELKPADLHASKDHQHARDSHTQGGHSLTDPDPELISDLQQPAIKENSSPFSYSHSTPNEPWPSNIPAKLNEFEQDYRNIGKCFIKSLIREKVTMEDLQIYAATLPLSVQTHYEEIQLSMVTKDTTNVAEFVGVLNKYSNVLSPALLADVIKEYGDEESKSLMNQYSEKLEQFQTETQVKQLVGVFHAVTPEGYAEIGLELKANWEEKSLKDIAPPKRTWLLKRVIYGSLRVVFSIADIEDLEEEDVREYLQCHVKRVFVNGKCILNFESDQTTASEHDIHLSSTDAHFVSHDSSSQSDSESGYSVTSDPDLISDFQAAVANTISGQIAPEESETVKVTEIPSDFRFSSASHGKNIILSEDGLEARKIWQHGSYACVYVAAPLSGTCELEVEVTDCYSGSIPGSLKIGVSQCTKGSYKHLDIPDLIRIKKENFCTWSYNTVYNGLSGDVIETKYGSMNLRDLKAGDKVAVRLTENGDLYFFFNGVNQGLASRNVYKESWDIYPVINVYGRCKAVRITRAELYGYLAKGYKGQINERISTGDIQFGFHPVTGKNIMLLESGLYARRVERTTFDYAVVYGALPIKHRSIFEIIIAEYDKCISDENEKYHYNSLLKNSSLKIGVMWRPKNTELKQSDIPINADDGRYYFVWKQGAVKFRSYFAWRNYGSVNLHDLREGDKIGMRVTSGGTLSFFVNGRNQGVAIRGLHKEGYDIYPVVDIFCDCHAVRITRAETHSEVLDLQVLCVEMIASCLDSGSSEDVYLLPLPQRLKNQIQQYIDYL